MEKYRKYLVWAGVVLAALLAYWVFVGSRDIRDSYSVALGEARARTAYSKTQTARAKAENAALAKQINTASETISGLQRDVSSKGKTIDRLTAKQDALEADLVAASTDASRVVILTGLVQTWKEKYATLYSINADKDGQIEAWERKHLAQEAVSRNYRSLWEEADGRAAAFADTTRALESNLRWSKTASRVKTVVIVALVTAFVIKFVLPEKST